MRVTKQIFMRTNSKQGLPPGKTSYGKKKTMKGVLECMRKCQFWINSVCLYQTANTLPSIGWRRKFPNWEEKTKQ